MATIQRFKREQILLSVLWILTWIGAFGVCCMIRYSDGDDAFFLEQITRHSGFFDFVSDLTKTMNGRITSTMALWFVFKLPLIVWRIFNAFVITAFAFILSKIIALFRRDTEIVNHYIFALASFVVIGVGVIGYSCLWITGSVNYLWPACAALFAVYPVLRCRYQQKPMKPFTTALCALAGLYAALAQEQIAAVLICCLAVILVKSAIESKRVNVSYAVVFLVVLAAALLLLTSPFTEARTGREMRWLPEYAVMSLAQKCFITWQWLIHAFTHSLRFVWMMLWIALAIRLLIQKKYAAAFLPLLFTCLAAAPVFFAGFLVDVGLNRLDMTKVVQHAPTLADLSALQFRMLLLWTAVILATWVLIVYQQRGEKTAFANAILYLAAIASCAVMLFSPSIYASGERTLFAAGILLTLIAANLRKPVRSPGQEIWLIAQIAGVGLLQLLNNADYLRNMIA